MAAKRVLQIGNPNLKKENKVITDFKDKKLKQLILDLKDTMNKAGLVGIAAPQIGKNYKVFVTEVRNTKSRNIGKADELRVYINPKITRFSKDEIVIYEGCGSVVKGALFGPVKRPKEMTIEAQNENGEKFSLSTNGLLSRVIQHEYDHMFGIEFIEKIFDYKKVLSRKYYLENIRNTKETLDASKITKVKYKKF